MSAAVRPALAPDTAAMARIYNYYIENTVITFEEEPVSAATMAMRVADIQNANLPWLGGRARGRCGGLCLRQQMEVPQRLPILR